jgi:hypothetical protein
MTIATRISSSPLAYRAAGVFFTLYGKCGVVFVLQDRAADGLRPTLHSKIEQEVGWIVYLGMHMLYSWSNCII